MTTPLTHCFRCGAPFAIATRSPHDPDTCTDCTLTDRTPTERMVALFRDCFQPRTQP